MRPWPLFAVALVLAAQTPKDLPDPLRPSALDFLEEDQGPLLQDVNRLAAAGEHRQAAAVLLKLLQRHPGDVRCLLALAECYARLRRPEPWKRTLEAAVAAGLQDLEGTLAIPAFQLLATTPEHQQVRTWLRRLITRRGQRRHAEMTRLLPFSFFSPDVSADKPLPLVVALHGRGGSVDDFAAVWEDFQRPAFRMAIPEAPYPLTGAAYGVRPNFSWDFPTRDRLLWQRADPQITAYVRQVVQEVRRTHAVSEVFLLGHSQGGAYAYLAALEQPGEFRGVIAVGATDPRPYLAEGRLAAGAGKVAVLVAHGTADAAMPIAKAQAAAEAFQKAGYDATWHPFAGGHTVPADLLREVQRWMAARSGTAR